MRSTALFALLLAFSGGASHADAPQKSASYRPRAPAFDPARARLLQPKADHVTLRANLGIPDRAIYAFGRPNPQQHRYSDVQMKALYTLRNESIARTHELDPKHQLLSKEEWAQLSDLYQTDSISVANKAEGIDFTLFDSRVSLRAVKVIEEKVRGALAKKLADALDHETPSPEKLAEVTRSLSAEHPMLASGFKVEKLIADMRRIQPRLGKWDFREDEQGRRFRGTYQLLPSSQELVTRVGHRAFEGANVMFANHMYSDSLKMIDTLTALGLEPENARFVATPYPFKDRVKKLIEHRGVKVDASAYDVEGTKKRVSVAINELLKRADENHGPIVVFDDGGMATEVIAKEHPDQIGRFRVIEITKAGERVAKTVLPGALAADPRDHVYLNDQQHAALKQKWIEIHSVDEAAGEKAGTRWEAMTRAARNMRSATPNGQIAPHVYGFAYYTYSNTPYKREIMTPLYTEQVNHSLFDAIERGDGVNKLAPKNKRVTIVGGGAMGIGAGRELREKGYEVTFVEPDPERAKFLQGEKFAVEPLHQALPGRGIILEMAGIKKTIGLDEIALIDDGAFVAHGSSKDNPFDMDSIRAMANKKIAWPDHEGQRSASYQFKTAGITKTLHFPGDGFTISHGGKTQNVPLDKFGPELDRLVNLGVYALENKPATYYPMFTAPESAMDPTGQQP